MSRADQSLREALTSAPLAPTETVRELETLVRGYLARRSSTAWLRGEADPPDWAGMARDQGWPGLAVAERHGGLGLGFAELATVVRECGRSLAFPELVSTAVFGAGLLGAADEEVRDRYLPRIAAGECRVAVVDGYLTEAVPLRVEGGRVTGGTVAVADAAGADLLLALARSVDGVALVAIDPSGLGRTPLAALDPSRPHARVEVAGASVEPVLHGERGEAAWNQARQLTAVALAAEQVGGAEEAFRRTCEYLVTRQQFGRPIASFQAVKHRCADMFVELQAARSAVDFAVWAADTGHDCLPLAAALAQAAASDAFAWIAAETVQLHGGIGFTWEHDAHLYFRRARADEVLLGDAAHHRAVVARLLDLVGETPSPQG